MVTCLVEGLYKAAHRAVNYDSWMETTWTKCETLVQFIPSLAASFGFYKALDSEAQLILKMYFIIQSSLDSQKRDRLML